MHLPFILTSFCLIVSPLCLYNIPHCLVCQYIFCIYIDRGDF
nr:MAG TPA: hypothetical protein [Caudoviricetes sp.]